MLTWTQFTEDKKSEDKEEKNGIDADKDDEKGESKGHKDKVKAANKEMVEFFEARKIGARRIASEARAKGGPAMLTFYHFAAKEQPYKEGIRAIENNQSETFFASKYRQALNRIRAKMPMKEFQEIIGIAEVWGEIYSHLFE